MKLKGLICISSLFIVACSGNVQKSYSQIGDEYRRSGDYINAEKYYRLSYENGNNAGIIGLGLIARDKGDFKKAEYYYLQAKNRGMHYADYMLGYLYLNNIKPKNCEVGLSYMVTALFNRVSSAKNYLVKYYGVSHENLPERMHGQPYYPANLSYFQREDLGAIVATQWVLGRNINSQNFVNNARNKNKQLFNRMIQQCQNQHEI